MKFTVEINGFRFLEPSFILHARREYQCIKLNYIVTVA